MENTVPQEVVDLAVQNNKDLLEKGNLTGTTPSGDSSKLLPDHLKFLLLPFGVNNFSKSSENRIKAKDICPLSEGYFSNTDELFRNIKKSLAPIKAKSFSVVKEHTLKARSVGSLIGDKIVKSYSCGFKKLQDPIIKTYGKELLL